MRAGDHVSDETAADFASESYKILEDERLGVKTWSKPVSVAKLHEFQLQGAIEEDTLKAKPLTA